MEFDFSLITNSLPLLLQGALVTLEITAMAVGLGLVFGLLAALAQLSKFTPLRLLAKIYVDFIRGTPLLVQIFIIYFALPAIIGQRIDPFVAAVAACSINSGASRRARCRRRTRRNLPRRHSVDRSRPDACRPVSGYDLGADDAIHHPAAGLQAHHPAAWQRIHRDVEGLLPRVRHRL